MTTHPRPARCRRTALGALGAAALAAAAMLLLWAAPAAAQQFEKVNEAAQEHIPAVPFVAIAYGFIWVAVLTYVLLLAGKLARTRQELDDLRRRLARAEGEPASRK